MHKSHKQDIAILAFANSIDSEVCFWWEDYFNNEIGFKIINNNLN